MRQHTCISEFLTLEEVTRSDTAKRNGLKNLPDEEQLRNLTFIAVSIFDPLRIHFGVAIGVSNGLRSDQLNKLLNGSKTSQHCKGEALDIDADMYGRLSNMEIGNWIMNNSDFDQLIFEDWDDEACDFRWIHVSTKRQGKNRGEVLEMYKENGKSKYKVL